MKSSSSLGWRAVYFVQRLISRIAPPLHSLHWKIMALLLVAIFLPALYFLWQVRVTIEMSHLRSTEQGMIDTGLIVAEALSYDLQKGVSLADLPQAREIKRRVFKDLSPNLRIVIYDAQGNVLSDTSGELKAGTSLAEKKDVRNALKGEHGARWIRGIQVDDIYQSVVQLYSTVPVFRDTEVAGAVSVIKSTYDVRRSIWRSLKDLAVPGLIAFLLATLTAYALSSYLTNVITGLARRADRIAAGESGVPMETWTKSELGDLARAMETMRRKLEGKAYVDEMVTTFSHELKTPLAAIRGAAEVAEDSADPATRAKFLQNIRSEVDRLTRIVTNMLALSRLETQPVAEGEAALPTLARELESTYRPRAEALGLTLHTTIDDTVGLIAMPEEDARRVIEVLLDNAMQFTPRGRSIALSIGASTLTIADEGPGIDESLRHRIFERFVTTVNPVTGRRGTGLGLAIARSLMQRHGGTIELVSPPGSGAVFVVKFPSIS